MYHKNTAKEVIETYRRRKQMAEQLPLIYGLVIVFLITAGSVLVFRVINSGFLSFMSSATDTPAPTETPLPSDTPTVTLLPLDALASPPADLSSLNQSISGTDAVVYTVKEGDTLAGIITQFGVSLPAVIDLNPGLDPDVISIGQEIVIPPSADRQPAAAEGPSAGGGPSDGGQPSAAPLPRGSDDYVEYQVTEGDTLASIALRYNVAINAIVAENNLENADIIQVGDVLRIPAAPSSPAGQSDASQPAPPSPESTGVVATGTPSPNP